MAHSAAKLNCAALFCLPLVLIGCCRIHEVERESFSAGSPVPVQGGSHRAGREAAVSRQEMAPKQVSIVSVMPVRLLPGAAALDGASIAYVPSDQPGASLVITTQKGAACQWREGTALLFASGPMKRDRRPYVQPNALCGQGG